MTTAARFTYTLDAGLYEELGYSRDEIRQMAADIEGTYPNVVVDLCWRGPVAHPWIDIDGTGDTDLRVEVEQFRDEWQKRHDSK